MNEKSDEKSLENISVNNILGKNPVIHTDTLILANPPLLAISCGDQQGFLEIINRTKGIKGIMWNETDIAILMEDRTTVIRYSPQIHPYAMMFFERSNRRSDDEDQMKIWDGEFEPVQFTKQNLIKFLNLVEIVDAPKQVIDAIKNMKVLERRLQEDSIDLDESKQRMVVEESFNTNLPKKFSLLIPVSEGYIGKFEFEAYVAKRKNKFGGIDEHKKVIVLRCLNARSVLRDRTEQILKQIPQEIPKYYGKMVVSAGDKKEW